MALTPNLSGRGSSSCVAGLFHSDAKAGEAIEALKRAGYSENEIGIASSGNSETGQSSASTLWDKVKSSFGKEEHLESSSELEDSLRASGLPKNQAQYFNRSLSHGGVLITVRAQGERATKAQQILSQLGADLAEETSLSRASQSNSATHGGTERGSQAERRIQLLGEVLNVHKERVQRGEVRLRKEVITENKTVDVPVTREELVIERRAGAGQPTSERIGTGEKEIRVPLSEEIVSVDKKPVVNEEVRVGKKQVQDTTRVSEAVRREELRTDRTGPDSDRESVERGSTTDKKRRTA